MMRGEGFPVRHKQVLKHIRKITIIRLKFTGFLPYLYLYIDIICIYIPSQHFFKISDKIYPTSYVRGWVQVRKPDRGHIPSIRNWIQICLCVFPKSYVINVQKCL